MDENSEPITWDVVEFPLDEGDLAFTAAERFVAPWSGRYLFDGEGIWALDPPPHDRQGSR